jgi:hypothetical protein
VAGNARATKSRSLRALQVLLVPRNRRRAPNQGRGVLPSVGQRHAQQPLVHVLDRAVSRPMGAVNLPAGGNGDIRGAGAWPHSDSVRTRPGGETVVARSTGPRLLTVARYSNHLRPRRSVNSCGPVTSNVSHNGIWWTSACSSFCLSSARSPAVARSRCSYGRGRGRGERGHADQSR